jgi:hypothetical protein
MKAYGGVDVYIHVFLTSALVGVSGQLHASAAFPPGGKSPFYPLDRSLDGPKIRSGRRGEEKIFYPTGTRTPTSRFSNQ